MVPAPAVDRAAAQGGHELAVKDQALGQLPGGRDQVGEAVLDQ
ncbi:hypothetical protein [Streptomyces erythrochromogenes]